MKARTIAITARIMTDAKTMPTIPPVEISGFRESTTADVREYTEVVACVYWS